MPPRQIPPPSPQRLPSPTSRLSFPQRLLSPTSPTPPMRTMRQVCFMVLLSGIGWVGSVQSAHAGPCQQKASKLRNMHAVRKALVLGQRDLHRCRGSRYVVVLARLAEKARDWGQAVNLWSIAMQRAETASKRKEYSEELQSAKEKFLEWSKGKLQKKQKKRYWDQRLRGGRGDMIEVDEGPSLDLKILFATNKSTIRAEGRALLDAMVETLRPLLSEGKQIKIIGHADNRGREAWNRTLSLNRAKSVVAYLQSKGLRTQAISVSGLGSQKPVASNNTLEGRANNRRVEFAIVGE